MKTWIEIPHGEFLVETEPSDFWRSIKMECLFRGMPWSEKPYEGPLQGMDVFEFSLITATCPCPRHIAELADALGFMREGDEELPHPL